MADPRMSAGGDRPRVSEDDQTQQAVLAILLHFHPAHLSVDELAREMTDRPDEFGPRDAIDNAVRDLVGAGLLHRHGPFVFATRAAVRFDELHG
jgi:hypothetical protein